MTPVLAVTRFTLIFFLLLLPLFTPFGSTVRGKGNHKIASIGHSVLGNAKVRYDNGFSIVFLHKWMSILLPLFSIPVPLFGLRSGIEPIFRYLHWSVHSRRSLRYAMSVILTLVLLHK